MPAHSINVIKVKKKSQAQRLGIAGPQGCMLMIQ